MVILFMLTLRFKYLLQVYETSEILSVDLKKKFEIRFGCRITSIGTYKIESLIISTIIVTITVHKLYINTCASGCSFHAYRTVVNQCVVKLNVRLV